MSAVAERTPRRAGSASDRQGQAGFRPDIEGLRALAIVPVVAYHASQFAVVAGGPSVLVAITALFGLLHGYAHGLELPASAAPAEYALGFLAATGTLHLSGITLGIATRQNYSLLSLVLGGTIAISGAYLLASA